MNINVKIKPPAREPAAAMRERRASHYVGMAMGASALYGAEAEPQLRRLIAAGLLEVVSEEPLRVRTTDLGREMWHLQDYHERLLSAVQGQHRNAMRDMRTDIAQRLLAQVGLEDLLEES